MMHTSQCSVECGSGIRLKTSVVCRDKVTGDDEIENVCENELITEEIPCHKDPCQASFGPCTLILLQKVDTLIMNSW